jgi:hypothetical protein
MVRDDTPGDCTTGVTALLVRDQWSKSASSPT